MSGVRRFRDLDSHKLAVQLRRMVVRLSSRGPITQDREFVRQIRNSARGGPRNIGEGFARFVPSEHRHFLSYAKASLDETMNHIEDGRESNDFSAEEHQQLVTLTERTLAAVSRMMQYLESPEAKRAYERAREARRKKTHRRRTPPEPSNLEP